MLRGEAIMQDLCKSWNLLTSPGSWYTVLLLALSLGTISWSIYFFKFSPTRSTLFNIILSVISGILMWFSAFIILSLVFVVLLFGDHVPPSAGFHNLNAAIKNTCYLDSSRRYCPKTVEELINIQAKDFGPQTENVALTYEYYPETNEYTLIVRRKNAPFDDGNEVAIFDPRFAVEPNQDAHYKLGGKLDFIDTGIYQCQGKYHLWKVPPFPGPWDEIN